jgi:RNA polymerase sigma factor (sigma-70 family)
VASYVAKDAAAQHPARFSDEIKLVVAFQSGEPEAGESIHRHYSPMVHSICARLLYDPEDVQEAVQETFLRIFRALPRFNGSYQLGAWIARISRNVCLDQIRSQNKRGRQIKQVEDLEESCQSDPDADPQELFLKSVEGRRVYDTLAALPPTYRAAILLRDLHGLAYNDIAATLSISKYQVKNFLHRGRESFRRLWCSSGAAAFLTLPTRLCGRVAKKCFRIVTFSQTSPRNGMPSPSIPAEVGAAATQAARAFETGHSILERAAVTMTATFVGIGGAGFASTERSLLPDHAHEASVQRPADLPEVSRSEIGQYDLMRTPEARMVAQTVSMDRRTDLTLKVVEDEQQSAVEEKSPSLEEGDVCYPPSSGVAEEASGIPHRLVDEAEAVDCIGTSLDSDGETFDDETSDGETFDDETSDGETLVAPVGDPGNGQILGGSGTDQVLGGDGDDDLEGGDGEDLIGEEQGNDAIADQAREDKGLDAVLGGRGRDQVSGGAGNDQLIADDTTSTENDDNDTPNAEDGSDLLQGGGGNDGLGAEPGTTVPADGSDDDTIAGSAVGYNTEAG